MNGPLQLGGASVDLQHLARSFGWGQIPTNQHFVGCISNFTYNDFVSLHSTINVTVSDKHKTDVTSLIYLTLSHIMVSTKFNNVCYMCHCKIVLLLISIPACDLTTEKSNIFVMFK